MQFYYEESFREYQNIISGINDGIYTDEYCVNYLAYDDYKYDYSHRDIDKMVSEVLRELKIYLKCNHSGEYAVWHDWCIHVASKEFAELHGVNKYIV